MPPDFPLKTERYQVPKLAQTGSSPAAFLPFDFHRFELGKRAAELPPNADPPVHTLDLTFIMSFRMRCVNTMTVFLRTRTDSSRSRAYTCSVQGSTRLGKRNARSPRAMMQLQRTDSSGAFRTSVNRSCKLLSLWRQEATGGITNQRHRQG
jgi:hypothetical protein